jgi:predicted CoA-binding protein
MISEKDRLDDEGVRKILAFRKVAIVGTPRGQSEPAHNVPKYMLGHGYNVFQASPVANEIFGKKSNANLVEIHQEVDIVDIFRPSKDVLRLYGE